MSTGSPPTSGRARCDDPSTRRARRRRRHPPPGRRRRHLRLPTPLGGRGRRGPHSLRDRRRIGGPRRPRRADGEDLPSLGSLADGRSTSRPCSRSAPAMGASRSTSRTQRSVTWSNYCAVDISENMLRGLLRYDEQLRPESRREPAIRSASRPTPFRSRTTPSISRSRAPSSCTWARASSSERSRRSRARSSREATSSSTSRSRTRATRRASSSRLKPHRLRAPNFMKYWTREEVERLLRRPACARRAARRRSSPPATRCSEARRPLPVPLARRVNQPSARRHDVPGRARDDVRRLQHRLLA